MSEEPIYKINYSKYKRIDYGECCYLEGELRRTFHTCHPLMERKKQLEQMVRNYKGCIILKNHFRMDFKKRKEDFYRRIIYEILNEPKNSVEHEIYEITKDILFIYSKKKEELEYIEWLSNDLEAELSHREEMRESMIEDFRGCD